MNNSSGSIDAAINSSYAKTLANPQGDFYNQFLSEPSATNPGRTAYLVTI